MLRRLLGLSALGALAAIAAAQGKQSVQVEFETAGALEVWVQAAGDLGTPPGSVTKTDSSATSASVAFAGDPAKQDLYVFDPATGNVARKTLKEALGKPWKVAKADFALVKTLKVRVEHAGAPVAAAAVKATAGKRQLDALIGPSDQGLATFTYVPIGPVKVVVEFKPAKGEAGALKSSTPQTFEVTRERDTPEPTLVVSLAEDVETVAAPAPAAKSGGEAGKATSKASEGSLIGRIATSLLSLLLVVGIGYGVFRYLKHNPTQVKDALGRLGVQVPEPDAAQGGAPPMAPAQPEPVQPIVLEDAAPTPLGTPSPVAAAGPVVANPRLVKDDGSVFLILEGASQVGREEGLPLSLVGESTVSRRHAEFSRTGDAVQVKDLGSTNGTYVNGVKLTGEAALSPGDTVQFGAVRYRYEV